MVWHAILEPDGRPGADNMAIDDALLRAAGEGECFLRLYGWAPPCLSFGRNEPATTRYDRDAIAARGVHVVRRPTGGRAVWHDAELTYAVAAPLDTFGSLRDTYRAIHEMLAAALGRIGIAARLATRSAGRSPGVGVGACFAAPAGGEVTVDGRKLIGSAQVREGPAFLQHGSILLENGQDVVSAVTRGAAPPVEATSLCEILGRPVSPASVAEAILREAAERWRGAWETVDSPQPPKNHKFGNLTWTWRR